LVQGEPSSITEHGAHALVVKRLAALVEMAELGELHADHPVANPIPVQSPDQVDDFGTLLSMRLPPLALAIGWLRPKFLGR
jgi:hypothetical protein